MSFLKLPAGKIRPGLHDVCGFNRGKCGQCSDCAGDSAAMVRGVGEGVCVHGSENIWVNEGVYVQGREGMRAGSAQRYCLIST